MNMPSYGVVGRKLKHSYTPLIYRLLADLPYERIELEPSELTSFVRKGSWQGINVTVPYKRAAYKLMDELSDLAVRLGNVNTITRTQSGALRGDNTDYAGLWYLIRKANIEVSGKQVAVLGASGGAGSTACALLEDLGAHPFAVGRTAPITYENLADKAPQTALILNATPVGMYPNCPQTPLALDRLSELQAVIDIVYNPEKTQLLLDAEQRGIPAVGGLGMLVAQAAAATQIYTGACIEEQRIDEVVALLSYSERNIVLIGMPAAGKTSIGQALAHALGRRHIDIDHQIEQICGMPCGAYLEQVGEEAFRACETSCLAQAGREHGAVISCGGGVVERPENYAHIAQNGLIVYIDRPLDELETQGRPLSLSMGVQTLAKRRIPLYQAWASMTIATRDNASQTASELASKLTDYERRTL